MEHLEFCWQGMGPTGMGPMHFPRHVLLTDRQQEVTLLRLFGEQSWPCVKLRFGNGVAKNSEASVLLGHLQLLSHWGLCGAWAVQQGLGLGISGGAVSRRSRTVWAIEFVSQAMHQATIVHVSQG